MNLDDGVSFFKIKAASFSLALLVYFATCVAASTNSAIESMLLEADLVFEGRVAKVEYRWALKSEISDDPPLPHTFVSFEVEQVIKGAANGGVVVLRFLGGPIDEQDALVMPDSPKFDIGDRDILLVKSDPSSACPLVQCSKGRFRFIDGLVASEEGRAIRFDDEGEMRLGSKLEYDDITTHTISESISLASISPSEDEKYADQAQREDIDNQPMVDPASFSLILQDIINNSHTSDQIHNLPEFVSVDPDEPFYNALFASDEGQNQVSQDSVANFKKTQSPRITQSQSPLEYSTDHARLPVTDAKLGFENSKAGDRQEKSSRHCWMWGCNLLLFFVMMFSVVLFSVILFRKFSRGYN